MFQAPSVTFTESVAPAKEGTGMFGTGRVVAVAFHQARVSNPTGVREYRIW